MKKLLLAAVILFIAGSSSAAQTVLQFALPTLEIHPRNQALLLWADDLKARSKDQLTIAFQHGVTNYPGTRIPAAVAEGVYDLGAPGWWHLSLFVPSFSISSLPMFYGQDIQDLRRVLDGGLSEALHERLEQALQLRVLGSSLDLGFGHIFTTVKPVKAHADLQGLNIRVSGGTADLARYLVFEATPRRIAARHLASALRRKLVGGLLATHNFVVDAALWEVGVQHGFLDNQIFYYYTPVINRARWEALLDEERVWLAESWAAALNQMRQLMANRQDRSRAVAARSGMQFVEVPRGQRQRMRKALMEEQGTVAKALEIDTKLIELARSLLSSKPH